jgi:hypothetical protein
VASAHGEPAVSVLVEPDDVASALAFCLTDATNRNDGGLTLARVEHAHLD